MRKHITQAEILRIEKLLREGVTDKAMIQGIVFVHEDCIDQVVAKFNKTNPKAKPKAVAKKETAADRAKAKAALKAVDPLS